MSLAENHPNVVASALIRTKASSSRSIVGTSRRKGRDHPDQKSGGRTKWAASATVSRKDGKDAGRAALTVLPHTSVPQKMPDSHFVRSAQRKSPPSGGTWGRPSSSSTLIVREIL